MSTPGNGAGRGDPLAALDARLARLHAGLDASLGFEARLRARIAALEARIDAAAVAARREGLERAFRRARVEESRLAALDVAAVLALGLVAVALAWLFRGEVTGWLAAAGVGTPDGLQALAWATLALVAGIGTFAIAALHRAARAPG